ncbi:MAG: UvrD-helicase domain-containing protein [Synergistaceae bacterium]|nr:UvrD-helicase domain-containing protein [Synergistaceae bacterium]
MKFSLPYDTPKGQREAITADDPTITVEAGAGTGKTWVLSQRYLRLLLDDDELLPSDILTLTYTEAAAGEMKARIESLIEASLKDYPDQERKQNILDGLSDSWISTIHAFSTRLIRESGLSLDIDPRASVISAHQEQSFWEDLKNAVEFAGLERLAQNYTGGEILKAAEELDSDGYMSAAVGKWGARTLSQLAYKAADLHSSSGLSWEDMMKWSNDDSELVAHAGDSVMDLLRTEWHSVWRRWDAMNLPLANNPNGPGGKLNNLMSWLNSNSPQNDSALKYFYMCIVLDILGIRTPGGRPSEPFKTVKKELGMTLGEWRDIQPGIVKSLTEDFGPAISKEEVAMRKTLLKFCAVSWGIWDSMKSKRGLLSFSDMILHAKKTIEQKGIRKTFKHVLVDEFQDTDHLQFAMIEALKNYDKDSRLFAVGDPKQSIYKFRHAEPSLFADTIKKSDKAINLDTSFRTRASLLARINGMFTNLWPDGISRQEAMRNVKYKPLSPIERESGDMPDFKVYLLRNDENADTSRKILAERLASKISSWVSDRLTIWDKAKKEVRPVKFSDFAVLVRGRGCFTILEEALESFGIPSIQDKSNDYFNRGEIGDVVCTLRAAANFNDDFSVMGWLMSPFSGVEEDDAITKCLMLADEKHKPIDLIRENLPDAYSRLEYLSVVGENEGASGIIAFYDRNRKWLSYYKEKDRLRVLRNVRLSLKIAREFQSSGTASLVSCAEYMTRSIRNSSQYEEPAWHDESENAVRLGTVHSAKGLEYPVTVIFADSTKKNTDRSALKPSRDLGLAFSKLPDEKMPEDGFKSKLSDWHKFLSEQGDSEEEERLFYVACTRAQDSLIFCGLIKPIDKKKPDETPKGYPDTWSDFMLRSIKGITDVDPEILAADNSRASKKSGHDEGERTVHKVQTVNVERSLRQISATSFALYEWCPYAWRRKYRQGRTLTWELPDRDNDSVDDVHGGAALGSLTHWILSRWPKGEDYVEELDAILYDRETLVKLPGYLRDTWRNCGKDTLRKWLMTFAESDLGTRLRNTTGVEREHTFRFPLNSDTAMAGAVDAVYGNSVADYKITAVDDVPDGLYDSQMDFYAFAIHEEKKFETVNATIAFLKENTIQERVIENFPAIRERIERAARECASGRREAYEARLEHCGECPFKKGCVKINAGIC